jgi:hypothetical protein
MSAFGRFLEAALYVAQNYAEHGVATYGLQLGARYALRQRRSALS